MNWATSAIVAYNEAAHAATELDLRDVLDWLQTSQAPHFDLGKDGSSAKIECPPHARIGVSGTDGYSASGTPQNWRRFSKR